MKLVKFVCTAPAHADGRSEAALTIHDARWAFCPAGSDASDHQWEPSEGLPISDALRFTPRQPGATPPRDGPSPSAPAAPATAKSKARSR